MYGFGCWFFGRGHGRLVQRLRVEGLELGGACSWCRVRARGSNVKLGFGCTFCLAAESTTSVDLLAMVRTTPEAVTE
jgi:hypothetical protein